MPMKSPGVYFRMFRCNMKKCENVCKIEYFHFGQRFIPTDNRLPFLFSTTINKAKNKEDIPQRSPHSVSHCTAICVRCFSPVFSRITLI